MNTIKGDALPQLPSSTLNNVLAGRLSGLHIQQTGTRPGTDDATFLIRGRSSFNSSQAPLVLVDGVARDFVDMDLNEIEGISVLKDAASLAWYGMNAANGVIYVTTKRGSASKTKVTFDVQGGLQTPVNLISPLNSFNYATLFNEAQVNDGNTPQYNQTVLDAYRDGTDPFKYPNVNFPNLFIKKSAPVQRYVATVSGGNSFAKYFTHVSFFNQDGLYGGGENISYNANTNFKRYNFRTNLDIRVNKSLDVALDVGGRVNDLRYPRDGNGGFLSAVFGTPSNAFPIYNADGTYGGSALFRNNPLGMIQARGNRTDLYRTLLATLNVKQKLNFITEGLSANVFYTYDVTGLYQSGFDESYEVYQLENDGSYTRFGNQSPIAYSNSVFNSNIRANEFWGGFDYIRGFGKHNVNFSTRFQRAVSAAPGRLDNKTEQLANRLSYNYKQKYFADFIATYGSSENFLPGNRAGWFPAISAGWIVTEENFLKTFKALDYFKLRGSYGIVGNDALSTSRKFAYRNYFSRGGTQTFFGTGYSNVPSTYEQELGNPLLTWERAKKASLGFDAYMFKQVVSISADYFQENREKLLTTDLLPRIIGQNLVAVNEGEASFKGVEGTINIRKTFNKVTVGLFGNYTYVKSQADALNEPANIPSYQRNIGKPIGGVDVGGSVTKSFLIAEGLFQSQAEIDAAPVQRFSALVKPGDIRYRDMNNDKVIDNLDFVTTDYTNIPTSYFGFGTSINYKNFDFSALFQGVGGRTIQINDLVNAGSNNTGYINQFSVDRWTPETSATAAYPRLTLANRGNNVQNSTFWLRSGDFIKLKHAEIGYTISPQVLKKLKLSSMRVYVSGFNLLTFDDLDLPIDAEIPEAGYNSSYPYLRTYSLGLNLKF
ncbi:SusC/RagA family TonB-linked outer membrane protein [Pedobacter aquae]|uniref:SusC/RagA family TonB-linked outer membrane protein n=1 Tax=Pedobacter aquae TaxID=2605747 RepID=A0A5C0VJ48_9SPHI|nr:SusC/RagA family TonB-linked outer membrane protein [Pedobacter aquae]QEK51721.1 SusC/RagA family TonB-linked outer membrane protein [Pedobacter aquae]